MTSAQHMNMQMLHALPAIGADVGDQSKTAGAMLGAQASRHVYDVPQSNRIGFDRVFKRLQRNDENMNWRLRRDIVESEAKLVFIHNVGGNLTPNDF